MAKYQFGFIGTGNMGGALAAAVCRRTAPEGVVLTNRTPGKAEALADKLGCAFSADNAAVARESRFLFLGVKPQMMAGMLEPLRPLFAARAARGERFVLCTTFAGAWLIRDRKDDSPVCLIFHGGRGMEKTRAMADVMRHALNAAVTQPARREKP